MKRGRKPLSQNEKIKRQNEKAYENYIKMYNKRKEKFGSNLKNPLSKSTYLEVLQDYKDAGATRPNVEILNDQLKVNELEARTRKRNLKKHIKEWKAKDPNKRTDVENRLIELYEGAKKEGIDFYKPNEKTTEITEYISEQEAWKQAYGS